MNVELSALLGIAASAALGYLWKSWYERRRTTRAVLYYLLEIHHWVARFHYGMKHFPQEHIERCRLILKRKGVELEEGHLHLLQLLIPELLRNLALAEIKVLKLQIAEPFAKALTELAKDDPLLAFELRGKDDIASMEEELEKATPSPISSGNLSVDIAHCLPLLRETLEDFEHSVSLEALERSIRATASSCGIWVYLAVRRHLIRASRVKALKDIDPEFSRTTQELIEKVTDDFVMARRAPGT